MSGAPACLPTGTWVSWCSPEPSGRTVTTWDGFSVSGKLRMNPVMKAITGCLADDVAVAAYVGADAAATGLRKTATSRPTITIFTARPRDLMAPLPQRARGIRRQRPLGISSLDRRDSARNPQRGNTADGVVRGIWTAPDKRTSLATSRCLSRHHRPVGVDDTTLTTVDSSPRRVSR